MKEKEIPAGTDLDKKSVKFLDTSPCIPKVYFAVRLLK